MDPTQPPPSQATAAVVGVGYVGLTTAVCLAHLGHRVSAIDLDEHRVAELRAGRPGILEEGLPELLAEGLGSGRLCFTTDLQEGVEGAELVFLCVPTPQGTDGAADLSYVEQAASQIGPHLAPGAVVIAKSTVPPGAELAVEACLGRPDVHVVCNPEFLREGQAVSDWLRPDRVVVGSLHPEAAQRVADVYRPLGAPVIVTDPTSASTIKYAANAFLALKVSFVNAVANVCEALGADAKDVLAGMGLDRRIGSDHLTPGPGWGGSCFPKDTRALLHLSEANGYDFGLLREAIRANEQQFDLVVADVRDLLGGSLANRRVAVWGLTFKAGTDDLRDSPALAVMGRLAAEGAQLSCFDPTVGPDRSPPLEVPGVRVFADAYGAAADAEVLVVLTEWPEFAQVDLARLASVMASPAVVDTRAVLEPARARAAGFAYRSRGRRR